MRGRPRRRVTESRTIDEKEMEPYRRAVRFGYISLQHRINEEQDAIASVRSSNFARIINDVEKLHEQVVKPREQVADAKVLLGLTNTVFTAAKSQGIGYISPSEFVSSLIRQFGLGGKEFQNAANTVRWKVIGLAGAAVFKKARGCLTMIGPMKNLVLKQRKVNQRRYRVKQRTSPKEVTTVKEENLNTEKNIAVMFEILRKKKTVTLENLILNRRSFAQTVENLFALSFLVKDGRVAVNVNDNGCHFISPRNAPDRDLIVSEEVKYHHFVFRLNFPDWKLMMDFVPEGEELMPHRDFVDNPGTSPEEEFESKNAEIIPSSTPIPIHSSCFTEEEFEQKVFQMASNATPVREHSRNRAEDMLETQRANNGNRKFKRELC